MSGPHRDSRPLSADGHATDGSAASSAAAPEGAPAASLPGASLTGASLTGASLREGIADYLTWHALRGSSARHQGDLRRMLAAFARAAGACGPDRPLAQIGRAECEAFLRTFQERDCKPNTLKAYHRVLDAFFRWLVAEERLPESPMRRVPKPRLPQEQVQPLTPEELARLLSQPDRATYTGLRDAALIAFLADTGVRITEALQLRLAHLDPARRSLTVRGKGARERTVFYGEAVRRLLREYLERRAAGEGSGEVEAEAPLFVSSLGEPLGRYTATKRIGEYGRQAGIRGKRVSAHTLRHTFAVTWCRNGGDAFSLQRLLGHTTPAMTARYVNLATGDLARLHRSHSPLDRLTGGGLTPDESEKDPLSPARPKRRRLV